MRRPLASVYIRNGIPDVGTLLLLKAAEATTTLPHLAGRTGISILAPFPEARWVSWDATPTRIPLVPDQTLQTDFGLFAADAGANRSVSGCQAEA
jgi:hypothetical protein